MAPYWQNLYNIMAWISNHIPQSSEWGITHPCPIFNGNLIKLQFRFRALIGNWIVLDVINYICLKFIAGLTHWGRVTHVCISKLTIIGSDNGLSPRWRQAIIWTSAGILLIGLLGTTFSEILIKIQTFPFKKVHLKLSSAKWRPFCLGLNLLTDFC